MWNTLDYINIEVISLKEKHEKIYYFDAMSFLLYTGSH